MTRPLTRDNPLCGYVAVQRYPFGETVFSMSTARLEGAELVIVHRETGAEWERIAPNRWYEATVFDSRDRETARFANPTPPDPWQMPKDEVDGLQAWPKKGAAA